MISSGASFFSTPLKRAVVGGDDADRLVTADEARAREHDRFEQVALGADAADAREVRADGPADVADLVARDALRLRVVEHELPAADVARLQVREHLFELRASRPCGPRRVRRRASRPRPAPPSGTCRGSASPSRREPRPALLGRAAPRRARARPSRPSTSRTRRGAWRVRAAADGLERAASDDELLRGQLRAGEHVGRGGTIGRAARRGRACRSRWQSVRAIGGRPGRAQRRRRSNLIRSDPGFGSLRRGSLIVSTSCRTSFGSTARRGSTSSASRRMSSRSSEFSAPRIARVPRVRQRLQPGPGHRAEHERSSRCSGLSQAASPSSFLHRVALRRTSPSRSASSSRSSGFSLSAVLSFSWK